MRTSLANHLANPCMMILFFRRGGWWTCIYVELSAFRIGREGLRAVLPGTHVGIGGNWGQSLLVLDGYSSTCNTKVNNFVLRMKASAACMPSWLLIMSKPITSIGQDVTNCYGN